MKKIKKYTCGNGDGMFRDDTGEWVNISDYNELLNQKERTAQKIGNQLVGLSNEHIKTDGLRFFGVAWADIQRTLEKYGYQHEEQF